MPHNHQQKFFVLVSPFERSPLKKEKKFYETLKIFHNYAAIISSILPMFDIDTKL